MSLVKILGINADFMKTAASKDYMAEVRRVIERILAGLGEMNGLPYDRPDIVQLIVSIETEKIRCLQEAISAKQMYAEVASTLNRFRMQHPGFDYLTDPAFDICFS
jgi:hypothetical protein